jgi:hypothetical protein
MICRNRPQRAWTFPRAKSFALGGRRNSGSLAIFAAIRRAFLVKRPSRGLNDNEKGIGKLLESSLPQCPKATTVALKQENAFARQTAVMIARTDGRGSF